MRAVLGLALALALVHPATAEAGKKKKKGGDTPEAAGWFQAEGWLGSCYNPPDFSTLASGPKRIAWQDTRNAVVGQWRGDRDDGIAFDERAVENAETALLAKPERIEQVARDNYAKCAEAMAGKGGTAWGQWVFGLGGDLTAGECPSPPMDYTLYDYLSIQDEWHIPVNVCKGDVVVVHGTDGDMYKLSEDGPWINVAGDPAQPASGSLPCTVEGCLRGQLIMRFTSTSGVQTVMPVGLEKVYTVAEHGKLEVMINDDTWHDNEYKIEKGLEHHTGIEYKPAGK